MRKTRIGALLASSALASATILGGAGIASAQESATIKAGGATVTATANDDCEITFELGGDTTADRLRTVNWVADYRIGDEEPSLPASEQESESLTEALSVFRPVVASNQDAAEALNSKYPEYDVGFMDKTVNLNDVVEPNEDGVHEVSFKFYRGAAPTGGWDDAANQGEVAVTGCAIAEDEGFLGSLVGSVDVFGSLGNMS